jgi:hypothetical protein
MVQDLRRTIPERAAVDQCACYRFFICRVYFELDESLRQHYELGVFTMHADTTKDDVGRRNLTLTADGDREGRHAVVNLLRKLRVLVKVGQMRCPLVFSFLFLL